ncbi:MAG: hypothetical protein QW324_08380 [Thermofilaceae archaeon]
MKTQPRATRKPLLLLLLLLLPLLLAPPVAAQEEQRPPEPSWPPPPPPPGELPVLRLPSPEALLPRVELRVSLGVSDAVGGLLGTAFILSLFIAAQRVEDDARRAVALGGAVSLMLGLLLGNAGLAGVGAVALAVAAALALS